MAGDDATRMRLVELRSSDGPVRVVRFAPRITLITGFGPPERLAEWISSALAGPRPAGVAGTVDVAGRRLTLDDLPATLLPPTESLVVSDADLAEAHRRAVEPRYRRVIERREVVQGQRAREEGARTDAALRFSDLERRLAEIEPELADAIGRAEQASRRGQLVARLESELGAVERAAAAAREPDPRALELAAAWDAAEGEWAELVETGPALSVEAATARVEAARTALDQARVRRATPADAERLTELQRAVVQAGDAGDGNAADAARDAERSALAEMGHSHASFLLGLVAPGEEGDDVRAAERLLALAEEELRKAQVVAALPSPEVIAQQRLDLRSRAASTLGRFPGDHVAAELRSYRPALPALMQARSVLAAAATTAGVHWSAESGPIEDTVREWIAVERDAGTETWLGEEPARVESLTQERAQVETDLRTAAAELVAIAARLRDLDRTLGELAVQETRLSGEFNARLSELGADDVEAAFGDALDRFVSGGRGPGRLPVIVGGVAAFEGANCEGAIRRLERAAQELQVVLVVDRPAIEAWARGLGEGAAVWSPDVAARAEEEERARREAAERARRETEARAVREAEEHAPVALVDLTAAETVAPPPSPPVVDLTDDHANAAQDDWWVPIVARPGTSRAARPVGEDLGQRRRRAEQIAADSTGSTTCDVHRNLETALHCSRCGLPFCDQCLALLGEPPALHCVDCALELSGARTDRSARGA